MTSEAPQATQTAAPTDVTGARIVAALIDIALMFVLLIVMSAVFGESETSSTDGSSSFSFNLSGLPFIIYVCLAFGYYIVLETLYGQTPGKKVMGLKVVAMDGARSWSKITVRTLLRIVDVLPLFYLIGFILMISSGQKQRLGDMAAGTLVVKAWSDSP